MGRLIYNYGDLGELMAQFWVNDTPGGPGPFLCQQTMDHGDERGWWGPSCSFVGLQDTHTCSGGQVLGGWPRAGLGTPSPAWRHPNAA